MTDATGGHYVSNMNPSPRVFPIPLYNPDDYDLGKKTGRNATLNVTGFIGFFLERIQGNEAYGRIFPITGVICGDNAHADSPPCIRDPAGAVTMVRLSSVIVSDDSGFRSTARRAVARARPFRSALPTIDSRVKAFHPTSSSLTAVLEPQSTMQTVERVRIACADRQHLLRGAGRGPGSDSPLDARRRQRIPDVAAGSRDAGRRHSSYGGTARSGAG